MRRSSSCAAPPSLLPSLPVVLDNAIDQYRTRIPSGLVVVSAGMRGGIRLQVANRTDRFLDRTNDDLADDCLSILRSNMVSKPVSGHGRLLSLFVAAAGAASRMQGFSGRKQFTPGIPGAGKQLEESLPRSVLYLDHPVHRQGSPAGSDCWQVLELSSKIQTSTGYDSPVRLNRELSAGPKQDQRCVST